VRARLIAETGVLDAYRFAHALVRETLYTEVNTSKRVRLHRRIRTPSRREIVLESTVNSSRELRARRLPRTAFGRRWKTCGASRRNPSSCVQRPAWRGCCACKGQPDEARALPAPVYAWFTEGFEARDLQDAKAFLEELG
jgi:hypothetical protein